MRGPGRRQREVALSKQSENMAEAGVPLSASYRCRSTGRRPFADITFFPVEDLV